MRIPNIAKLMLNHKKSAFISALLLLIMIFSIICIGNYSSHHSHKITQKQKVLLIGIDAADWDIINALIENNQLPNLKKMRETGVSGTLTSIPVKKLYFPYGTNYLSPAVWTSVVTSRSPEEHGIIDFAINGQIAGPPHRKTPAVWNILSTYYKKSAIIGWFCTWPSEEINGFMVSSNLGLRGYNRGSKMPIYEYPWASKWKQDLTYPPEFLITINRKFIRNRINVDDYISQNIMNKQPIPISEGNKNIFSAVIWQDLLYFEILKYVLPRNDLDFIAVYFEGIDTIQHSFWKYTLPSYQELINSRQIKQDYRKVITNYYAIIDAWIGEIAALAKDKYTIIIVSDHGGVAYPYNTQLFNHSESSIFYASGPAIKQKHRLKPSAYSLYDILPTILYILNVPISKEFHGTIMKEILTRNLFAAREAKFINEYPITLYQKAREKTDLDEEYKEKLKALGYSR